MNIESISIEGFANIPSMKLKLEELTALVAPNGYGKSNLLRAVEFGSRFIKASDEERQNMMSQQNAMPINRSMLRKNFRMGVCGLVGDTHFEYGYSFQWESVDSRSTSSGQANSPTNHTNGFITKEWLRIRQEEKKYRQALLREVDSTGSPTGEYMFLSSPSGRCTTKDSVNGMQLALQKLAQNEGLFYAGVLKALSTLTMPQIDTLDNPEVYFSADNTRGIALLDGQTLSGYLFRLRNQKPRVYGMLENGIKQLVPHLTKFEPHEIVLADGRTRLYDILIEERNAAYPTSIRQMSSGSKRVVLLFTLCVAAREKGLPLLMIEEPENSVHPRLLENLLLALHDYAGETKVLITSHSPYLMRYLRPKQMYFGLPNEEDVAKFAQLKDSKVKTIARYASAMELTVGEYMFDFMLDLEQEYEKIDTFFQM